ncbi:hypothetical protein M408DRAFT_121658 [Serendipita vermifera MAFF 305830]|uniref:Uncharacterized protein n=1 Tax=Serendipita vermifera MAFF 305830 TaxID=933852 RepID=A0A0C2XJP3_SERVB|nr:hypothetical protein M408DRAFT_121658 [Serendipita vermifera MAFF 305830]
MPSSSTRLPNGTGVPPFTRVPRARSPLDLQRHQRFQKGAMRRITTCRLRIDRRLLTQHPTAHQERPSSQPSLFGNSSPLKAFHVASADSGRNERYPLISSSKASFPFSPNSRFVFLCLLTVRG